MAEFYWRSFPSKTSISGEGVTTVFVHEKGSDEFGDGTRQKPYKSLSMMNNRGTAQNVYCIGVFTEDLATDSGTNKKSGNHNCTIRGDYWGAATFDGKGTYCIYGYGLDKMHVINTGVYGISLGSVAGVGRAAGARYVSAANLVHGVAGSFCRLDACIPYMGCVGATNNNGSTWCKNVVYSRLNPNEGTYALNLGGSTYSTYVDMPDVTKWRRQIYSGIHITFGLFSNTVVIANEAKTYNNCFFGGDTKFYCFKSQYGTADVEEVVFPEDCVTSADRQAYLLNKVSEYNTANGVNTAEVPTFNSCIFSTQTRKELFADPDHQCYNLHPNCEAVTKALAYYGALPPAISIPVYTNSEGKVNAFDEKSVSGCICIQPDESFPDSQLGIICIDEASSSLTGEIHSKILTINPHEYQFNGIYTNYTSKFNDYATQLNRNSVFGDLVYYAEDVVPKGIYMLFGPDAVVHQSAMGTDEEGNPITIDNSIEVKDGGMVFITTDEATFESSDSESYLLEVLDPCMQDVVYCRCRSTIYKQVDITDTLYQNVTYYNCNEFPITYHNRTIAPKESFVCVLEGDHLCEASSDYENAKLAIMFDDRTDIPENERLVPKTEWIPAQLFGEYFVHKQGGVIQRDSNGIPMSSGNNNAYGGTAHKSILNQTYVQFSIFVNRFRQTNHDNTTDN